MNGNVELHRGTSSESSGGRHCEPIIYLRVACAVLVCSSAFVPSFVLAQPVKTTPLILEKDEGEHRVWRPVEGGDTKLSQIILKVDPHNGGSSHLVLGTEDMPPGGRIETHRHPGPDEILMLQNGQAKVTVGNVTREVHGGATVFFMRAESVREGQKVTPVTKTDAAILATHSHAAIYKQP